MAALVPAIHVLRCRESKDVDGRHKAGHDELIYQQRTQRESRIPWPKKNIAKTRKPAGPLYRLEHRAHQVISRHRFALRMALAGAIWLGLTVFGLVIGMAGYAFFETMSITDAYVNAAIVLSGMGPLGELKSTGGKIFAGSYAIFSGLLIVIRPASCWRRCFIACCTSFMSSRRARSDARVTRNSRSARSAFWCSTAQSRRRSSGRDKSPASHTRDTWNPATHGLLP